MMVGCGIWLIDVDVEPYITNASGNWRDWMFRSLVLRKVVIGDQRMPQETSMIAVLLN